METGSHREGDRGGRRGGAKEALDNITPQFWFKLLEQGGGWLCNSWAFFLQEDGVAHNLQEQDKDEPIGSYCWDSLLPIRPPENE